MVVNRTRGDLTKTGTFKMFPVTTAVKNFMPGGLADTEGASYAIWDRVDGLHNEGPDPVNYKRLFKIEQGQSGEKIKVIESNWNIKLTSTISTQVTVGVLVAKAELSLETAFGGSTTESNTNAWYNKETVEETISEEVKLGVDFRIYQPKMGFKELGDVVTGPFVTTTDGPPKQKIEDFWKTFDSPAKQGD